jgi:hypothetical protein
MIACFEKKVFLTFPKWTSQIVSSDFLDFFLQKHFFALTVVLIAGLLLIKKVLNQKFESFEVIR